MPAPPVFTSTRRSWLRGAGLAMAFTSKPAFLASSARVEPPPTVALYLLRSFGSTAAVVAAGVGAGVSVGGVGAAGPSTGACAGWASVLAMEDMAGEGAGAGAVDLGLRKKLPIFCVCINDAFAFGVSAPLARGFFAGGESINTTSESDPESDSAPLAAFAASFSRFRFFFFFSFRPFFRLFLPFSAASVFSAAHFSAAPPATHVGTSSMFRSDQVFTKSSVRSDPRSCARLRPQCCERALDLC